MCTDNLHKGARRGLFVYAREHRKAQTKAELLLWHNLRDRKLAGAKFRRQHPIADFVADFYCHKLKWMEITNFRLSRQMAAHR